MPISLYDYIKKYLLIMESQKKAVSILGIFAHI